jgi:hypothetical protein
MTTTPDFTLSAAEFDLAWGSLGLGPVPYPLEVPSVGRTEAERAEEWARAFERLAARGLATRDRLAEHPARLLRLLADHDTAIDVLGHHERPLRALAAATKRSGVLAELTGGELRVAEIRPTALAAVAAAVPPEAGPGRLRGLSVRADALDRALSEEEDLDDPFGGDVEEDVALVKAGVPEQDAAMLVELAETRRAGGQFGVTSGGVRSATVLSWFDTDHGRYLVVNSGNWLSINPADRSRIEGRLAEVAAA